MTTAPASTEPLAFLRITRAEYPDRATYVAARPADVDGIMVKAVSAGLAAEPCDLELPADLAESISIELAAASPRRSEVIVGSTWRGRWFDGRLAGQAAP